MTGSPTSYWPPSGEPWERVRLLSAQVPQLDETAIASARRRHAQLTKPPGSLGRLEELAIGIAGMRGEARPRLPRKAVIVMAADHGVAAEGVSAYPAEVTPQMVANFLSGGAAISVLARQVGARVVVADLGVATELPPQRDLRSYRVGPGTANMARGPAMSREQAGCALLAGVELLEVERTRGLDLVATGEMGIANTTAASAIVAAITGGAPSDVTGQGTGVDDRVWAHKVQIVEQALAVNQPDPADALDVLAKVGGFEIGGLAGLIVAAAAHRVPIVLDGFIAGAAALLAVTLCPAARAFLIAGHCSAEVGHRAALDWLGLTPLLDLGMRLGEGSGAVMAMPLVDAALAILDQMVTFDEAGVANRE